MKTKQYKTLKLSCLFLLVLFTTQSCMVSSLNPLYSDMERIHKEELNGKWIEDDGTRIEIITITDTTGLAKQSKNMQGITKLKHKKDVKFKVKYSANKRIKESAEKDPLSEENRFMMGLNKKKNEEQFTGSSKKNNSLSKEDRFMMGLDQDKKAVHPYKIPSMKQVIYYMYPSTRKHYEIKLISNKDTTLFIGRLAKLGKYYFLDIIPEEDHMEKKLEDDYMISLVMPMHGFIKVEFINEKLKLNWIYSEDFKKLRKNKKIRLEHISRGDRKIITAKTSDIQKFLIKFADSKLFNNKDAELILSPLK